MHLKSLLFLAVSGLLLSSCQSTCPGESAPVTKDSAPIVAEGETIALPTPVPTAVTLTKALESRRSVRAYGEGMVSIQDVSNLLWSANGINREDGKRTAPSARNLQSVSIYVAFQSGTYFYDFKGHQLVRRTSEDLRSIKEAPMELIFTSNLAPKPEDDASKQEFYALLRGIDAGTASENAALYCAAAGLGTVIRMYHEPPASVVSALKLDPAEKPLFFMPVGLLP
ncbi:MAG: nitroreductase family protein [Bradymonadia bacterium]